MLPKWMSIGLDVKENVTQVNVYRSRCQGKCYPSECL